MKMQTGEIKSKLDALNTSAMKLGEIMYKQNPQTDQGSKVLVKKT